MTSLPQTLPKRFSIEILKNGSWAKVKEIDGNARRLVKIAVDELCEGVRYTLLETYGAAESKTFLFMAE